LVGIHDFFVGSVPQRVQLFVSEHHETHNQRLMTSIEKRTSFAVENSHGSGSMFQKNKSLNCINFKNSHKTAKNIKKQSSK